MIYKAVLVQAVLRYRSKRLTKYKTVLVRLEGRGLPHPADIQDGGHGQASTQAGTRVHVDIPPAEGRAELMWVSHNQTLH